MAGSEEKVSKEKPRKKRKDEKHLSDQLEERFVGSRTEVFSRISAKENEIRSKTSAERAKADRLIEDNKGEAAALKRKATLEEIGKDVHARIIAEAHKEINEIEVSTAKEETNVEKTGARNMERAVDFIVQAITQAAKAGS